MPVALVFVVYSQILNVGIQSLKIKHISGKKFKINPMTLRPKIDEVKFCYRSPNYPSNFVIDQAYIEQYTG